MRRSPKLFMVLAAAVIVVLGACGGSDGAGSVTLPSSVSRPTNAPTSPGTTEPPASAATTSGPPDTEAPTRPTEAPTTGASPTEPATEATSDDDSSTWWPWVLLAVVAVAVVVGVVLFAGSRKKSPWPANASAALAQSDEISTHLVGLEPGGLASVASADAARLAALAATVQQLASSAPDARSMQALMAMRGPLQSLHAAVDAVNLSPTPPSALQVDQVRAAATGLHQATSLARANVLPPPPQAR